MVAPQVGSGWDVAPTSEAIRPHHLREWISGSAVDPALAAANLQSLIGAEVVETIAGDRLEAFGGWSAQYATAPVARLLRQLEPLAEAGGWWCSGLDPLADWSPMDWGQLKPDQPRIVDGDPLKYEAPHNTPTRSIWLKVPAAIARKVADRFGLALPAAVAVDRDGAAGAFWRWWAADRRLPLLLTEGAKKAGALLSVGVPAVALPGIWNGCPGTGPRDQTTRRRTGPKALLPDLAGVNLSGRRAWVLFDHSSKRHGLREVRKAADCLGRLLAKAGAEVLVGTVPAGPLKGADDWLAAGRTWEALAKALEPLEVLPVLPQLRRPDRTAPAGSHLADGCPIPPPEVARLVALSGAMGSGKTEAIAKALEPLQAVGVPIVLISHRRSIGAANAERFGLPWGDDCLPGSDLRQTGVALCLDSLCPTSALRFRAADWRGAVVILDEAAQLLSHGLFGTGTAIADRRPAVLQELAALLEGAAQVIAADAQLSDDHLAALETATGARALLIGSRHRPAFGRQAIDHRNGDSWRSAMVAHLRRRECLWIATTAQQAQSKNAAQNLERLALKHWPEARVLRVDSETINDPAHDAHHLAADPNGIAGRYDVVIASPAVAAGLSVDQLPGHFAAVFVFAGGNTDPAAVAQAAARVRDDCPRHLFAPERSPGSALREGSGSTDPHDLLRHQARHGAAAAQLVGTIDPTTGSAGPWLPLWAKLAAVANRQRLAFRATVCGLLEREGYTITPAEVLNEQEQQAAATIAAELQEITTAAVAAEDQAVMAAELLSDAAAHDLLKRARRTPAQRAQLARWRIARSWGLGDAAPSPEVLEADREGLNRRRRFGWLLQSIDGRQAAAAADRSTAVRLAPDGAGWLPDLCRELITPKLTAADALGLPRWLERRDWFDANDGELLQLQALATAHRGDQTQVLEVAPAQTATGTLRRLLHLAGYKLEAHRSRVNGNRAWRYRVTAAPLPDGVMVEQLEAAWRDLLSQEIPLTKGNA